MIRAAVATDAPDMADLLNRIIAIGGTTAHEKPKTAAEVAEDYILGPDTLTCVVAEDAGRIIGWQAVGQWQGDAHIGTFVDPSTQARGIGASLFAATLAQCKATGLSVLHAAIRADNVPGLAYYSRMGFIDMSFDPGFALTDGRVVGRVTRVFHL